MLGVCAGDRLVGWRASPLRRQIERRVVDPLTVCDRSADDETCRPANSDAPGTHQSVVAIGDDRTDEELFGAYMYSRAQSVMGGTSQIQKNIIAQRILGLGASG